MVTDTNQSQLETIENQPFYRHAAKTFGWMFLGLLVTFFTSYVFVESGLVYYVVLSSWITYGLLLGKLVLVAYFSTRFMKMSHKAVKAVFLLYAVTTGVVFSSLTFFYDISEFHMVFGVVALFFCVMAAVGLITKRDVTSLAPLVTIGLISMVMLMIVNIYLNSAPFDATVSLMGMALFLCITTYDTKKMKDLYTYNQDNGDVLNQLAIYSAFDLYLDFINIFLFMLRLSSRDRD